MNTGKLVNKLTETNSIKFTDYAINRFQGSEEQFNNTKAKNIIVKFDNCDLKGLKLYQYKGSRKKYFVQQIWFDKRSHIWTVGEFRLNIFGTKECRTQVVNIMKTHTDDNGMWIKNPKITQKQKKDRITKAELQNRKMLTVREAIVKLCEANFPKISRQGTLTG